MTDLAAAPTEAPPVKHPAKWSKEVLEEIAAYAVREALRNPAELLACDPFAGVGLARLRAALPEHWTVIGGELEPEWAAASGPGCVVADALRPPWGPDSIDVVVSSLAYGNRMADSYPGGGVCRRCAGLGTVSPLIDPSPCDRCGGGGRDVSSRMTYRIALGRPLSRGSAARVQWGPEFRGLHGRALARMAHYLKPGGLVMLNLSNHIRGRQVVPVVEWHLHALVRLGFLVQEVREVGTRRYGHGANREARVDAEHLLMFRKPTQPEEP